MEWRPIILTEPEANDVFRQVQSNGVTIALDGLSRAKAIEVIDSFLNQYEECFWTIVIRQISFAIREELLKSRNVIDVKLVREVVEYLSNRRGVEKKKKEEGLEEKKKDEEEESSEGSGEESEDEEDSDQDLKKEEDSDEDSDDMEVVVVAEGETEVVADEEEEIDDLKDDPITRQECIEDLVVLSSEKGLSVKEGEEDEILDMMIPYLRGCLMYTKGIMIFLRRVREHIDRCSTLNDLETVKAALENSIFREEYEDWKKEKTSTSRMEDVADAKDQVNHQLKKNMVPTKEEAIAAPMNQIKQEKRVCGDIMEIEEMETLTPLNLPEQAEESTGNAIKESLERGGANKRKLSQI